MRSSRTVADRPESIVKMATAPYGKELNDFNGAGPKIFEQTTMIVNPRERHKANEKLSRIPMREPLSLIGDMPMCHASTMI
jgi:hypothetical protein